MRTIHTRKVDYSKAKELPSYPLATVPSDPTGLPSMPVLASGVPYLGACQDPVPLVGFEPTLLSPFEGSASPNWATGVKCARRDSNPHTLSDTDF